MSTKEVYLVVGGEGFLGKRIVLALIEKKKAQFGTYDNSEIRVLDIKKPDGECNGYKFYQSDINDKEKIRAILRDGNVNVTTVFHTASPIMKAAKNIHKMVNIDGTKTLLEVCKEEKVKSFIYTSSASVVYSGAPLVNVDETIPYPQKFADYYSETKAIAEKMCLAANSPSGMKTLAIRPSGIFGPGDAQTTPGALIAQKKNFPVLLQVGNNTALFDFTYVDNIVDAHISASDLLSSSHNTQIQGQAFFITNGQPIGMWSFLRLIWAQVGDTRKPLIIIPNIIATFILYFLKLLACIGVVKHEVPFVFGMTFTSRYFNITKAKTLLNYSPRISYAQGVPIAVKSCLERWKSQDPGSSDKKTN